MGKRIISQRRGKGSHTFKAKLRGINSAYLLKTPDLMLGEVTNFIKENGRNAIMAEITFADGRKQDVIAAEGMYIGQKIEQGNGASTSIGNVSEVGALPEGCPIFNIERTVNDGEKWLDHQEVTHY